MLEDVVETGCEIVVVAVTGCDVAVDSERVANVSGVAGGTVITVAASDNKCNVDEPDDVDVVVDVSCAL